MKLFELLNLVNLHTRISIRESPIEISIINDKRLYEVLHKETKPYENYEVIGVEIEDEKLYIAICNRHFEEIDKAEPSEALKFINTLITENDYDLQNQNNTGYDVETQAKYVKYLRLKSTMLNTIKQALQQAEIDKKKAKELAIYEYAYSWACNRLGSEYYNELLKRATEHIELLEKMNRGEIKGDVKE